VTRGLPCLLGMKGFTRAICASVSKKKWPAKASEADDGEAMVQCAQLLALGVGLPVSREKALYWLELAAAKGVKRGRTAKQVNECSEGRMPMNILRVSVVLHVSLHASAAFSKCKDVPSPVGKVELPSRYTDGSATRSEIDKAENARVNEILKPVDKFVSVLAKQTTDTLRLGKGTEREKAKVLADCVMAGLDRWATADALSRLTRVNAKLAIPSRIGGAAFAYALAPPHATRNEARKQRISTWLLTRAKDAAKFFDDPKTPPRAASTNLRMWATLAVLRVGLAAQRARLVLWSQASFRDALCAANKDGSLPLEMERGPLALHYQIHAVAPIVVGIALLKSDGKDLSKTCGNAVSRVVSFTVAAIKNPALASAHGGVKQKGISGVSSLEAFELAWIPVRQSLGLSPNLKGFAPSKMVLSNSKLGGNQTLIWEKTKP
jgi:poly(beta-D-mannuronate) lyase